MAKKGQKSKREDTLPLVLVNQPIVKSLYQLPRWSAYVIVFIFSCLLYSNTLWNQFAIDDMLVLTHNEFTKKGVAGIGDHLTHDMMEGSFGERGALLVSGGRYRPLSLCSLSLEYEIMRQLRHDPRNVINDKNVIIGSEQDPYLAPMLSHGINILLFGLTSLVLYCLFLLLMPLQNGRSFLLSIPFIVSMLYAAHPIHTEVVANIKGRDELMCMLFSLLSLLATMKYIKTKNVVHLLWGLCVYFIALLSKENALTVLAIIPLTYFFFTGAKTKDYLLTISLYIIPVAIFLLLRSMYTQTGLSQESPEILNNPFVLATPEQHYATIVLTFLYYFKLLIFPHPLTHDYYYNQIPYIGFSDLKFVLSFIINVGLLLYAVFNFRKKTLPSYAILFYFITFSIVSNLLFTVGVLMNERFIYTSSLGFCILLAWLLLESNKRLKFSNHVVFGIFAAILSLYSVKTFVRNYDWKDSFTLFRRDVWKSPNSSKIQTALGGDLIKVSDVDLNELRSKGKLKSFFNDLTNRSMSDAELNSIQNLSNQRLKQLLLDLSVTHLHKAIQIYKGHSNAWLLLGNALYNRDHKPEEVIPIYKKAAKLRSGGYFDAYFNLGIIYNDMNDALNAKKFLHKAHDLRPDLMQIEYPFLLAQVYAKLNQPDLVGYWFNKGTELKKPDAADYYLVGIGFGRYGNNLSKSIEYLQKALELSPNAEPYYQDLGVAYGLAGKIDDAIAISNKLIAINPQSSSAYMNLSISYRNKGNKELADKYLHKYNQLVTANNK